MATKIYKPEHLAKLIHEKLIQDISGYTGPSEELLSDFFEVLFYTSLNSEEGELIKVTVTLYNPDEDISTKRRHIDRWRFVKFVKKIPFEIKSLAKLAKAADPWSSSLAVYFDSAGRAWIYGLLDQELHLQSYLNYETDQKPEAPGLLQASINGIGILSVVRDYKLMATLNQDSLVKRSLDVLKFGVISRLLQKNLKPIKDEIFSYLDIYYPSEDASDWEDLIDSVFRSTLSRILNRIRSYHHGGALLMTDEIDNLDIKYEIRYNRLATSMISFLKQSIKETIVSREIKTAYDDDEETMDIDLHNGGALAQQQKLRASSELKGAIRFIASQGCVDGLILMSSKLNVRGFGTVITELQPPEFIYVATATVASDKSLTKKSSNHFGTRHRSMFAYCWENPSSIGFVISQDGDIRAITKYRMKLVVWDNIKTQQLLRQL